MSAFLSRPCPAPEGEPFGAAPHLAGLEPVRPASTDDLRDRPTETNLWDVPIHPMSQSGGDTR